MRETGYRVLVLIQEWLGHIVLIGAIYYLARTQEFSLVVGITLSAFMVIIDKLFYRRPDLVVIFFAKRTYVTWISVLAILLIGALLVPRRIPPDIAFFPTSQFLLQGIVVGAILRALFGSIALRTLLGASFDIRKLLLLAAVAVLLWLFPLSEAHGDYALFYIVGIGLGLLLHFTIRSGQHSRATRYRRGWTFAKMIREESNEYKGFEWEAIRLFSKQDWKRLSELIKHHEKGMSTKLAIVKASMLRVQGKYHDILELVDHELMRLRNSGTTDSHLLLHRGLALGEISEENEAAMLESLEEALKAEPTCPLVRTALCLKKAEKVLDHSAVARSDRSEPLKLIQEALLFVGLDPRPAGLERVTGGAIPINRTFLVDAYAYALVCLGEHRVSRSLLTLCIRDDPGFSAPYLHLGEWYLSFGPDHPDPRLRAEHKRLCKLCLLVVESLEGHRNSHMKRRAESLLEKHLCPPKA